MTAVFGDTLFYLEIRFFLQKILTYSEIGTIYPIPDLIVLLVSIIAS